jgi:hypothetical protein
MLKNLMTYYTCAQKAVESNVGGKNLTWAKVRDATSDEWYRLSQMKFEDPKDGEEILLKRFHQLCDDITKKFERCVHILATFQYSSLDSDVYDFCARAFFNIAWPIDLDIHP